MEGNVSGIDLSELMQARKELNQELGIETDPNMYNNYNPNRAQEEIERLKAAESSSQSEETDEFVKSSYEPDAAVETSYNEQAVASNQDEQHVEETDPSESQAELLSNVANLNYSKRDFSVYDSFSPFEIPENANVHTEDGSAAEFEPETLSEDDNNETESQTGASRETVTSDEESDEEDEGQDDYGDLENEIDSIIKNLADSDEESADEEIAEDNENLMSNAHSENEPETEEESQIVDEKQIETETQSEVENQSEVEDQSEAMNQVETDDKKTEEIETKEDYDNITNKDSNKGSFNVYKEPENQKIEASSIEELENNDTELILNNNVQDIANGDFQQEETREIAHEVQNAGIIDEEKLERKSLDEDEIADILAKTKAEFYSEEENVKQNEIAKIELDPAIKKCKFIDIVGQDDFKNSGKLSYILGKNQKGEIKYGELDKLYNTVIFANSSKKATNLIYSILFSLMLKNSKSELNIVLCDNEENSKLKCFNSSSHMLFNRVSKNNEEIIDIIAEISSQLEKRYKLLAKSGAKSIEQHNLLPASSGFEKMPYMLLLYNNFNESIKSDFEDKISSSVYQLLRLGRKVGIYFVIVASGVIENEKINYNLTSRIGYKTETISTSILEIGSEKLEELSDEGEIIVLPIETGKIMHLSVPQFDDGEIGFILKHIEG